MSELSRWRDRFEIEYYAKNPKKLPPEFTPETIDSASSSQQFTKLLKVSNDDIVYI